MRERQARRFKTSTRLLFFFTALTGGAFALAGVPSCADALHLDPPSTTDGGGTGGGSSHPDGGGSTCSSNKDCSYPTGTCDLGSHTCVGCVSNGDCADQPGTVCSQGACMCPSTDGGPALTYCPGATGGCVDTNSSPANCGGCGFACYAGCSAGKCAGQWTPTGMTGAPDPRAHHVAVWTGTQMFVWGGKGASGYLNTGGLYDPVKQTWTPTPILNAPTPRADATAVWTGTQVIVWGGIGPSGQLDTGALYNPSTNTWRKTSAGGPSPRTNHTAVWASTGATQGMIVFGGSDGKGALGDGAIYTPGVTASGDTWTPLALPEGGAPTPRQLHTAVWDTMANRMLVFGGTPASGAQPGEVFAYDPTSSGSWTELNSPTGPVERWLHTAVWDSMTNQMVVFGGTTGGNVFLNDGAQLSGTTWSAITTTPEAREGHTAVVLVASGTPQMVVFGGDQGPSANPTNLLNTGYSWSISGMMWSTLDTALSARTHHTAVVVTPPGSAMPGSKMVVWGGDTANGPTNTGAVFDATVSPSP